MFDLTTRDIKYLQGVGPQRATLLNKELDIYSLHDLFYYFPYKYVDRSRLFNVSEIDGRMPHIQLCGEIRSFEEVGEGASRRYVAHFTDGTGFVDLVWFRGIKFIKGKYKLGTRYIVFGKPTIFNGRANIAHPDIDPADTLQLSEMGLQPYYNTTERMKRSSLNSQAMAKLTPNRLGLLPETMPETLSSSIVQRYNLMPFGKALRVIHFPSNVNELRLAEYRLKFEELFYIQLGILNYSKDRKRKYAGYNFAKVGDLFNRFYSENLPFELTGAQKRVVREIRRDVNRSTQMNRLVQGEVGSGKTLVALLAMLLAKDNGYQACMMAPTEILAEQHFSTLRRMLAGLPVRKSACLCSPTSSRVLSIFS